MYPGTPLTYLKDRGSNKFFGSEILAKRDSFGLQKNKGIFWGEIVSFISSNKNNILGAFYCFCGIFSGMLKNKDFFG